MRIYARTHKRIASSKKSNAYKCTILILAACTQMNIRNVLLLLSLLLFIYLVYLFTKDHKKETFDMSSIDKMSGETFERLIYELYKQKGYKVCLTKKTGDYGADLIIYKGMQKTVVQIKRYHGKVGIKAIQEVIASKAYYKAQNSKVITNSYFTRNALEMARKANVEVINRDGLIKMLNERVQ